MADPLHCNQIGQYPSPDKHLMYMKFQKLGISLDGHDTKQHFPNLFGHGTLLGLTHTDGTQKGLGK
jgi:hypothetical protein